MSSYQHNYYLTMRPVSEEISEVEPFVKTLLKPTGMDHTTLRQRLTGSALQILMSAASAEELKEPLASLKKAGISSAVINRKEIAAQERPRQVSSLSLKEGVLELLDIEGTSLATLSGKERCLLVISTMEFKKVQSKRMARRAMTVTTPLPPEEILKITFASKPVLSIYISGHQRPFRLDSTRFNYNCLGKHNKKTIGGNFPFIIKLLRKHSATALLDAGFGENSYRFLNLSGIKTRDQYLTAFTHYSHFIYIAARKGLFSIKKDLQKSAAAPVIATLGGVLWAGVLPLPGLSGSVEKKEKGKIKAEVKTRLKTAPDGSIRFFRPGFIPLLGGWGYYLRQHNNFRRAFGPPIVLYPLLGLIVLSLIAADATDKGEPLSLALLSLGLLMFIHAFVLIRRKRLIENCPTSRIKTMPMGEVEVQGYARQKYFLKAPFSLVDCVYYSYKIYDEVHTNKGRQLRLREAADSGGVQFYLEDDSGKVLINPESAIIKGGNKETFTGGNVNSMLFSSISIRDHGDRIEETFIPAGGFLYIIGFADRIITSAHEKRKRFVERIRELKNNRAKLNSYDANGDGDIDDNEWDNAKSDLEEQMLTESLTAEKKDNIVLKDHPAGGLFYISDNDESSVISSLGVRIPLFLVFGISCFGFGTFYLLKLLENGAIVSEIRRVFF